MIVQTNGNAYDDAYDESAEIKSELFRSVATKISDELKNPNTLHDTGLLMDMMKSLSSDEDIEEVLKKLKSNIEPNENISEDGNSETAAENETEQANDNAKDKDNKESNND